MADKTPNPTEASGKDVAAKGINEKSEASTPGVGRSGTLIVTIIGFLVMILTPLATYVVMNLSVPKVVDGKTSEAEPVKVTTAEFNMEVLLVNIAGTKGTRILRMVPHLVISEEGLIAKITPMKTMLADKITSLASGKTIDDLDGAKGREMLKEDIKNGINTMLQDKMAGAVVNVYFSEFLIQ